MSAYKKKLRDPRWQRKRLEILERDGWACRDCGSTSDTLHVDHSFYDGSDPWEYDESSLLALCGDCHKERARVRNLLSWHTVYMTAGDIERLAWVIGNGCDPAETLSELFRLDEEEALARFRHQEESKAKRRR